MRSSLVISRRVQNVSKLNNLKNKYNKNTNERIMHLLLYFLLINWSDEINVFECNEKIFNLLFAYTKIEF